MNSDTWMRGSRRAVLVVDDEAVNREMLGMILEMDYEVVYAENGREAIDIIQARQGRISMVLLDILMPVMDGIAYLKTRAEDPMLSAIPVIVLTADRGSELETLRLGALDFIPKPYDMPEIILARVRRIIAFVEDRQIIRDVEHDALTGLYNRNFFYEYCRRLSQKDDIVRDMLAIDIDRFRLVNEVYGKSVADAALKALAEGIGVMLGGRFGIACRSDADLFYVYCDPLEDPQAACDRLLDHVQSRLGPHVSLRLRMGLCRNVTDERTPEWYCDAARSACDTIRSNYARSLMIYDDALHDRELLNERLIADIDEAIRQRQFRVFYQPKYDITGDTPALYSAEALVRWQHPELGFISPGAFIPLFEENGLISRLDDYVWREAARQIRAWKDEYGVALPVSVNLSRMDFYDDRLPDRLMGIVRENGIDVKDLTLEVTESAYSQNMDHMLQTIGQLREAGFQIEMDDFGSGYSSLNMLCIMPLDALKIDMRFVRNLVGHGAGYRMVELVIEMARCLNIPAIVEGVEDEDQYRLMKRAGCDVVQGYYFSRPLNADDFTALLLREKGLAPADEPVKEG